VGTGLQVMNAILDENVTALAGPKRRQDVNRVAVRHGSEAVGEAIQLNRTDID
jgi:hypothetical protein